MDEAFEKVTGYKALSKPETFQLSVLEKKRTNKPYWITRPDGSIERNGDIEGKEDVQQEGRHGQDHHAQQSHQHDRDTQISPRQGFDVMKD